MCELSRFAEIDTIDDRAFVAFLNAARREGEIQRKRWRQNKRDVSTLAFELERDRERERGIKKQRTRGLYATNTLASIYYGESVK